MVGEVRVLPKRPSFETERLESLAGESESDELHTGEVLQYLEHHVVRQVK